MKNMIGKFLSFALAVLMSVTAVPFPANASTQAASGVCDANIHSYEAVETIPATHLTEGVMTYTCSCGDSYTKAIMKLPEHIYKVTVTAPTCTEQGFTQYSCECGDSFSADYIDAKGHDYEAVITTPVTHISEGIMTYTCFCGYSYTESITMLPDHIYKKEISAPTCIEQGFTTYTCECGESYVADYVDIKAHSYTAVITTPATHLTEGVMNYSCECGDSYTEIIPKLGEHNYKGEVTAPTCTQKGYTTFTCECGESYVDIYVDTAEHNYTQEITSPATCTQDGIKAYTCTVCKYAYTEDIPKLGHDFSKDFTVDKQATYTEAGSESKHCLREGCTEKSEVREIPKLAAVFTDSDAARLRGEDIMMIPATSAEQLLSQADSGAVLKDSDGNLLTEGGLPGTGMTLTLSDGKAYTLVVMGDADGDGKVSAADARLALRASVGLENYKEDSAQYKAANVGSEDKLSAADARLILRASVGLEDPTSWLK